MSTKLGYIAGILIFALVVTLPPIVGLFTSNDILTMERRKAAAWPAIPPSFSEIRNLPIKIDSYVNDHIGLRDEAVFANGMLHWLVGSPYGPVLLGNDGNLFRTNYRILDLYRGVFRFRRQAVLEERLEEFQKLRDELAKNGTDFYMTLVPNKITLFGEHTLPEWVNKKVHTPVLLAQYEKRLAEMLGRRYISTLNTLKPYSGISIYSKYGTHWNELGGLIAFSEIATRISDKYDTRPVNIQDFNIQDEKTSDDTGNASAAGLWGYLKNNLPKLKPKAAASVYLKQTKSGVLARSGAAYQTYHFVNEDPPNNLKVLLIGDSFTLRWHATVPTYFKETVFMHHNLGRIDMKTLNAFKPDFVVFQMVEQQLSRYFRFRPS